MKCPNCDTDNADNELFCLACGQELSSAGSTVTDTSKDSAANVVTTTQTGPLIVAIKHNDQEHPLHNGSRLVVARIDSDKCRPDIAVNSNKVSSAPVEFSAEDGKAKISVDPRGVAIRVVKVLQPGQSMEIGPGEMAMLGDEVFTIS